MNRFITLTAVMLSLCLATFAQAKPQASRGIMTAAATPHSVTLQGCADATPGVQFNFYRGTAPGAESATPLNATPLSTCNYIDTAVTALSTYYYWAKAFCATCVPSLSGPSNEVTALIPADAGPLPPTGLATGVIALNSVPMLWVAPFPAAGYEVISYFVMRSAAPGMTAATRIAIVPSWRTYYTDPTCVGTCYYAIKADDIFNSYSFLTSPKSNVAKAVE